METEYQPINCNYYDVILAYATKRTAVEIKFENLDEEPVSFMAIVKDVYTKNKEEFILLESRESIRLDKIVSIGGVSRADFENGESCKI